ncbi:hypothetical protein BGX28_001740 [Mortierella sp. GBA30]|nr:hypothetical protein BGX28_001740 [Mortierella sp. GBA30]
MPPTKKKAPSASASRNSNAKSKAGPYNKNTKGSAAANKSKNNSNGNKNAWLPMPSKPTQARNKHKNFNLTTELDSLLGDLNSQLQRKKTKSDVDKPNVISDSERRLNEAQEKHESMQQDMMSALEGISALGK